MPSDPEALVRPVESRSYLITATSAERESVLGAVRGLLAGHPQLAERAAFDLPYRAFCFRAQVR